MRRKIITAANLPKAKKVECRECEDTGQVDTGSYRHDGSPVLRDCFNKRCPTRIRIKAEREQKDLSNRVKRFRNEPCVGCANRGYTEWGDGSRTPCSKNCSAAVYAIAHGLVEPPQ